MQLKAAKIVALSFVLVASASLASHASADDGGSATTPVVPRGVELPARVGTPDQLEAMACRGRVFTSITGGWGPTSSSSCGVAGYPGYKVPYYWTNNYNPMMCTNGLGYNAQYVATWYYTGCGWTSRTYAPWGNVLATPKMRASASPPYVISAGWYNYL